MRKQSKIIFLYLLSSILFSSEKQNTLQNSPLYYLNNLVQKPTEIKKIDTPQIDLIKNLKLVLPCKGINVPKRTMRLPNAPRNYRNGIHKGIDFFSNWGTPVRSVADGIVIRSDLYYEEVPADFRESVLESSSRVGKTPSDIFNSILLGQSVFIDHGFDLIKDYRVISIYAHLSHINSDIKPGRFIEAGEIFAKSGNSGVKESTLGSRKGSHLHWELIMQKDQEEIFLGKGISNPELYEILSSIFYEPN